MLAVSSLARAEVKLAYVDVQRALNECQNGHAARVKFRAELQKVQGRMQREQAQVEALKDELQKKGMLMKPQELQNLQDQYSRKLRIFQNDYRDTRAELKQKDSEITTAIVHDLAYVVRSLAERNGYTMVLERGQILWAPPSLDITDQVIRAYDAMHVEAGTLGSRLATAGQAGASSKYSLGQKSSPLPDMGGGTSKRSTIAR